MVIAIIAVVLTLALGICFYGPGIGVVISIAIMGGFILFKLDQLIKKLDELNKKM